MLNRIFKWNGKYWGFTNNNYLYDKSGIYHGWIESNGDVWNSDGSYMGKLIEDKYILRPQNVISRSPRHPRNRSNIYIVPVDSVDKIGRTIRAGWEDALN